MAKHNATLHEDAGLSVTRCDNLIAVTWRQAPTMLQMKLVGTHIAAMHHDFGEEIGFVNLAVSGRAELISKEVRDEANRLARRWTSICQAHVILVDGIAGIVVRSIVRAMVVVSGNSGPWRVFSDTGSAAPWIAERLDGRARLAWSAKEVDAILAELAQRAAPRGREGTR
jgi:hypothetical protein